MGRLRRAMGPSLYSASLSCRRGSPLAPAYTGAARTRVGATAGHHPLRPSLLSPTQDRLTNVLLTIDIVLISDRPVTWRETMKERPINSLPGIPVVLAGFVIALATFWLFISGVGGHGAPADPVRLAGSVIGLAATLAAFTGLYTIQPNQAAVLSLFGKYVGTVKEAGLRWNNPSYSKRKVSQRVRNFESGKLKVNDLDGSPIEIAAVIVWQVVDASEAVFNVDDYESFVHIQSEAALRAMASSYPYDQHDEGQIALRSHPQEISEHLQAQIAERLGRAGVEVIEARISHLAYAPEIAQAMLQRQQANAV